MAPSQRSMTASLTMASSMAAKEPMADRHAAAAGWHSEVLPLAAERSKA